MYTGGPGFPGVERTEPIPTASLLLSLIRNARELDQATLLKQAFEAGLKDSEIVSTLDRLMKEKQIGYTTEGKTIRFFATESSIVAASSGTTKRQSILGFIKETRERGLL